jgi:putative methyltransferase (TIGR04325 family)
MMTFGYVLARVSHRRERVSLLDWGGGIGQYSVYARALLPDVDLDYHCRELPLLASAGRSVLPDITFHDTDASLLYRAFDLVMASGSLHYSEDWRSVLQLLTEMAKPYLYVTRLPIAQEASSFVVLQRPYRYGYLTEYPGWFLNRQEFLEAAGALGLSVLREFLIDERPDVPNSPEAVDYRGFLFRRGG